MKVGDYYDLPDCETYQGQDEGVACVPEKGETQNSFFRAANYPSGAVDPTNPREVDVTFASYINRHSNESNGCVPQGYNPDTFQPLYDGVKTAGACNNDVLISRSTNRGTSFSGGSADVRTAARGAAERPARGPVLAVGRLRSARAGSPSPTTTARTATDESTGFSDMSLSGSRERDRLRHRSA